MVICLAAPVPVPVAGCARQSEGGWSPALLCCLYRTRTRVNRGRIQPGRAGSGRRWNTHSRSNLVGDRLAGLFYRFLTGNQIADSERVSPACLNPSVRRRSAGSVLVARAARGRPVGIPNGGYLRASPWTAVTRSNRAVRHRAAWHDRPWADSADRHHCDLIGHLSVVDRERPPARARSGTWWARASLSGTRAWAGDPSVMRQYATRSGKARVTAAVRLETFSRV